MPPYAQTLLDPFKVVIAENCLVAVFSECLFISDNCSHICVCLLSRDITVGTVHIQLERFYFPWGVCTRHM